MKTFTRRSAFVIGGAAAGWVAARRYGSQLPVYDGTTLLDTAASAKIMNDASGLSPTPINKHLVLSERSDDALIDALRKEITEAATDKRSVNIGAARHSMGGQAIPRDGTAITFDNGAIELDRTKLTYRVHAGARWSQVIAALDAQGFSPAVMQSNNDFGVAATFSVNAHGWPVPYGPMGATVRSLRLLLPSGDVVDCSPADNSSLFNLAMGG